MADYKLDFEPDVDKTYCDLTKVTVHFGGFPFLFWFFQLLYLILFLSPLMGLGWYSFLASFTFYLVSFCKKNGITIFQVWGFVLRKRSSVYYPVPRSKRHSRMKLRNLRG